MKDQTNILVNIFAELSREKRIQDQLIKDTKTDMTKFKKHMTLQQEVKLSLFERERKKDQII